MLIELVKQDSYPNIVYLGRPCQYGFEDKKCEEKYCTTARFSEEVITMYQKIFNFPRFKEVELLATPAAEQLQWRLLNGVRMSQQNNHYTSYITVEGSDHSHGWKEKWADLLKISPLCR